MLGNGDGTFQSGALYGTTDSPTGLVIADFNRDGKLDLGVAGGNSILSVLLGLGDGTFVGKTDYGFGGEPSWVTTADLNDDGKLDLVGADQSGGVALLFGNGDGTFLPLNFLPAGPITTSVAVGDFNNDGNSDLAAVNEICRNLPCNPGTVSIFIGNGSGGFQPAVNSTVVELLHEVAVDDFNKDGNLDLAVTSFSDAAGDSVSVLLGNGDGTFQTPKDYATAPGASCIATGDFNGDGVPDMAIGTNASVSILLGNGDGTFKAHVDYSFGASSIVVGDLNGDGKLDLAAGGEGAIAQPVSYFTCRG